MSLEGNLSAFGLSEILQLVAVQKKSGMLSINSHDRSKVLFFRDGMIISTRDRRRRAQDPLTDYLVRYGIISRDELRRLSQLSAASKLDLTDVMVSEGVLTEDEMKRHYRNHVQEAVHEILTWQQCSYKFIPGIDIIEGLRVWGEHQIEGILMESMRRIDEFPQILELFPSATASIRKTGELEDQSAATPNEKRVVALLDTERSLTYLIAHAQIPKYETYEALRHLHNKGLIETTVTEPPVDEETVRSIKRKRRVPRRNLLPFTFAFLAFVASLAWCGRDVFLRASQIAVNGVAQNSGDPVTRNRVESRVRWLLESYRAARGGYPQSLGTLASEGFASSTFIQNAQHHELRYSLTADGSAYTLR